MFGYVSEFKNLIGFRSGSGLDFKKYNPFAIEPLVFVAKNIL